MPHKTQWSLFGGCEGGGGELEVDSALSSVLPAGSEDAINTPECQEQK